MKKIKIGSKEYDIKRGDYVLYNQYIYQFCAGDERALKRKEWDEFSKLRIPKDRLKEIPFDKMKRVEINRFGTPLDEVRWYFSYL